ncbi:hypothetical protein J6590_059942 [Homalodisca vitripennis]|nr:hypothetical protein J6590_059942 [Homalodisca vitripennis]
MDRKAKFAPASPDKAGGHRAPSVQSYSNMGFPPTQVVIHHSRPNLLILPSTPVSLNFISYLISAVFDK